MPKRKTQRTAPPIDADDWLMMLDRDDEADQGHVDLRVFLRPILRDVYLQQRDAVLAEHTRNHPGTRVSLWWSTERDACGERYVRTRLGEVGTPESDTWHALGVPTRWESEAFDYFDAPIYESQASFLDRHGLFFPGERERLTEQDFVPEVLSFNRWPSVETDRATYWCCANFDCRVRALWKDAPRPRSACPKCGGINFDERPRD